MNEAVTERSIEEFHSSQEYKVLTSAQRVYVDALIETQDPLEAARQAYPRHRADENYLRVLLFKAEDSPRLQSAIAKAFGLSDREQTIRSLRRQVQRLDGAAKVSAMALLAQITGALPAGSLVIDCGVQDAPQVAGNPKNLESHTPEADVSVSMAPRPTRVAVPQTDAEAFSEKMFRSLRNS